MSELNRMIRSWRVTWVYLRRKRLNVIDKNFDLAHSDVVALIIITITINTLAELHLAGATFTRVKSNLSLTSNRV